VNGKASRQRKERQARDKAVDWQEASKERGRRKKHRGSDTMSCNDRVQEAARADCGTRQGAGSSQKHGLERWRQQAKRPLYRPSIQGRVPACALLARYWISRMVRQAASAHAPVAREVRRLATSIPPARAASGGRGAAQLPLSLLKRPSSASRAIFAVSER
jgi:hypothetical protein